MPIPLYRRLLGTAYDRLPTAIRDMHDFPGQRISTGRCEIQRGSGAIARWLADLLRLPHAGSEIPLRVEFMAQFGGERWTRTFGEQEMRTVQIPSVRQSTTEVVERLGPVAATMDLVPDGETLRLETRRVTLFGLPLPRILTPRIEAFETVRAGLFRFDVRISLPIVGLLVHYQGYLIPLLKAKESATARPVVAGSPIMMFDGVCNLCCAGVRFFMARDRQGLIRYCALQSETGQAMSRELGLPLQDFETFVVRDGGRTYFRSDAYIHLLRYMPFPWRMLLVLRLVPRPIRDWAYDRLAQTRYRIFGRRGHCMVPTSEQRKRFV